MPPKVKVTKEDIINAAIDFVREKGGDRLNARELATQLNCSTQPIFSNFRSMDELWLSVMEKAYALYRSYVREGMESGKAPPYKASGMAYIEFARKEKELFKLLFMCDRNGEPLNEQTEELVEMSRIVQANVMLSEKEAPLFHFEMWVFVHGIATMIATGYLDFDKEQIGRMLSDAYQGLKTRYEKN